MPSRKAPQRYTLTPGDDGTLRVSIPARYERSGVIMLCLWICFWCYLPLRGYFSHTSPGGNHPALQVDPALILWAILGVACWSLGGLSALFVILWQLRGREIIQISPASSTLTLRRELFGIGIRTRTYELAQIRKPRIDPRASRDPRQPINGYRNKLIDMGLAGGYLAFDHGEKIIHFAAGLELDEARRLLKELSRHFPRKPGAGPSSPRRGIYRSRR